MELSLAEGEGVCQPQWCGLKKYGAPRPWSIGLKFIVLSRLSEARMIHNPVWPQGEWQVIGMSHSGVKDPLSLGIEKAM